MAAFWRVLAQQGRTLNQLCALTRRPLVQPACLISTSKKNKDVAVPVNPMPESGEMKKLKEHFADTNPDADKNWVSFGYEPTDPGLDNFVHHVTMFFTITLCICWGSFILAYQPDHKNLSWGTREAFLELERREREGLPLVNPNYIDPSQMELPSDEELGDTEIIV